jgi:tetratricopeptide (TPR) repeat protein
MKLKLSNKLFKIITIFSIIFYLLFSIWYKTNFYITTYATKKVTSSFILESSYWLKRDLFWLKSLQKIKNTNNQNIKTLLLKIYNNIIPVNQYWSPLITYKLDVMNELINYFTNSQEWESLRKISTELSEINPANGSNWYNLGLSLENLGEIKDAIKAYQQTLTVDNTHAYAIINLANIYIDKGQYYQAYQIIKPYLNQILSSNKVCIFWAKTKFIANSKNCSSNKTNNQYFLIPISLKANEHMLRIDTPSKNFQLKKIELISTNDNIKTIIDFNKWTLHELTKEKNNNFISTGEDPYLYNTLSDINLSNFDNVKVYINFQEKIDPEIQNLISEIKKHISLNL